MNIKNIIRDLLVIYTPKRIEALTGISQPRISLYKNGGTGTPRLDEKIQLLLDLHKKNKRRIDREKEIQQQEDAQYVDKEPTQIRNV